MKINTEILEKIENSDSRILVVTKYLDTEKTLEIIEFMEKKYPHILEGFGENRVVNLKEKELQREKTHFIGNIQTKEIKFITKYCSTIHSVDSEKHLKKMEEICEKQNTWIEIFLQINVDENKDGGIKVDEIPYFLEIVGDMENVSLVGFSAIGKANCSDREKEAEFDLLLSLRDKYLPNGFVSAGTSRDYEIALEKGIDIVRIGNGLFYE